MDNSCFFSEARKKKGGGGRGGRWKRGVGRDRDRETDTDSCLDIQHRYQGMVLPTNLISFRQTAPCKIPHVLSSAVFQEASLNT